MTKSKCKHEFQRKFIGSPASNTLGADRYYCKFCLLEVEDQRELNNISEKKE